MSAFNTIALIGRHPSPDVATALVKDDGASRNVAYRLANEATNP